MSGAKNRSDTTITLLQEAPSPALAAALETFERQFTYPLGTADRFHISHGNDYACFFRAIGGARAASFIALDSNRKVLGTLGAAIRLLRLPDKSEIRAVYLGDLKTNAGPGRGRTLLRLSAEVNRWSRAHGAVAGYGIVMDGTTHLPDTYSGKCDIPSFRPLAKLGILRIPVPPSGKPYDPRWEGNAAAIEFHRHRLGGSAFIPLGGTPQLRSESVVRALVSPDGCACALLEDTRHAKRLIREDGRELVSGHLSRFSYSTPSAGVHLIHQARLCCAEAALAPALFVSVPAMDAGAFLGLLRDLPGVTAASATVYGTGLDVSDQKWMVCTSEI